MSFFYLIFNVLYLGKAKATARNSGVPVCRKLEGRIRANFAKRSQFAGLWPEIRNELNGCDFKKQSQFAG